MFINDKQTGVFKQINFQNGLADTIIIKPNHSKTIYVDSMPTSEVTRVTLRHIDPLYHGHTSQSHGHEWMTHILFIPCQSAIPFLRLGYIRIWPWNSKGKVIQSPQYPINLFVFLLTSISNNSCDTASSKFDLETCKVKVMSDVQGQFHINQTNHSWNMAIIVFWPWKNKFCQTWRKWTGKIKN